MKFINKKNLLFSTIAAGMLITLSSTSVHASTTSDSSNTNTTTEVSSITPDKSLIRPVASNGSQTLKQVAQNNNVSLKLLEKLNANLKADEVIPNGTMLYLPQNEDLSLLFVSFYTAHSGISSSMYQKYYGKLSASERSAKLWIAKHESGYYYKARNGRYYGRFQLDSSYLHGDYSVSNQERTADRYVKQRYGSWAAAKRFWLSHHWY